MKRWFKGVLILMLFGMIAGCGEKNTPEPEQTTAESTTSASTTAAETTAQTTSDPGIFLPDHYYDYRDESVLYSSTTFRNISAVATENGSRFTFHGVNGSDICDDPFFELPNPNVNARFELDDYPYVVIIADSSRCDLQGILRFHTTGNLHGSYPSILFNYNGTGRQKIIIDLHDEENLVAVDPRDVPVWGKITDLRIDIYENEASITDEFTLEAVAFFATYEEAELFKGLPPIEKDDPSEQVYDIAGKWLAAEFTNPSADYRARKLLYQFDSNYAFMLDSLEYMGYGGVITNVPLNSEYLKNDGDFALLKLAFEQTRRMNMVAWIYDEYQWPSGKAFGYVLDSDPSFEATGIEFLTVNGEGNIDYTLSKDYICLLGASLETKDGITPLEVGERTVKRDNEGEYTLYLYARRYAYAPDRVEDRTDFFTLRDVDLLNPDAVARFIEITYDKYHDKLGDIFNEVEAFFTDEPQLGNRDYKNYVVWTDALPQVFLEMHGYSINDNLHSLFAGQSEQDRAVRVDFYQTVSEMFSRAYTRQISAWCEEHGVSSSGHFLFEESIVRHIETYGGNFMGIVGEMDIPGGDILHVEADFLLNRNMDIGSVIGLKYVSSAAKNVGKTDVLLEFTPLADPNAPFVGDPGRYSLEGATIATFCGANKFGIICPDNSFTADALRVFNSYIGRINALLDNSTTVTPIGLFVPTDSARAEHLVDPEAEAAIDLALKDSAMTLLENGLDFTFLDSPSIEKASIDEGELVIGLGRYSAVVLPSVTVISSETAEKLSAFEAAGGRVIWIGSRPEECEEIGLVYSEMDVDCISELSALAAPDITVRGGNENLFISHYTRLDCGKEIYYLANLSKETASVEISFADGSGFDVYLPIDGNVISADGSHTLDIDSCMGVLVVRDR